MGWLFGWHTRKELIEHLVRGNGIKTVKHCTVGNNLWCVHELDKYGRNGLPHRFICLYLLQKSKDSSFPWGYKDIDESCGPYHYSCPRSYLDMCHAPEGKYSYGWRQAVYRRHGHIDKMKAGVLINHANHVYKILKRRSPASWLVQRIDGTVMRAGVNVMMRSEVVV